MDTFDESEELPGDEPGEEKRTWLAPYYNGVDALGIQLPEGSELLSGRALTGIRNAWTNGVVLDTSGHVWVREDRLHIILRTTTAQAAYLIGGMPDRHRRTFRTSDEAIPCVSGTQIAEKLDALIQSPRSYTQREYGQYSWALYTHLRDHPEVGRIVALHIDRVNAMLPELKQNRIDAHGITSDELTGEPLQARAQFSHIRGKRVYPHLALEIWNGLVINKTTHDEITRRAILDEHQLLDLVREMGWSDAWYLDFFRQAP